MTFYALDELPAVDDFVAPQPEPSRERLVVRITEEAVDIALELPESTVQPAGPLHLDALCQVVEGVSHFVLVTHRARRDLSTSQLELELQAEVDKWLLLALGREPRERQRRAAVKDRLFEGVSFADPAGTERGDRYRKAHRLARRFIERLERRYLREGRHEDVRAALFEFYRLGPGDKVAFAEAA
ncbi:MAG: hypothetical protein KC731_33235 [Myxococcales bacterium]|nr:hypothetical protein [Myxococcales bacterium]